MASITSEQRKAIQKKIEAASKNKMGEFRGDAKTEMEDALNVLIRCLQTTAPEPVEIQVAEKVLSVANFNGSPTYYYSITLNHNMNEELSLQDKYWGSVDLIQLFNNGVHIDPSKKTPFGYWRDIHIRGLYNPTYHYASNEGFIQRAVKTANIYANKKGIMIKYSSAYEDGAKGFYNRKTGEPRDFDMV